MLQVKNPKIYLFGLAIGLLILGGLFLYLREYQALPAPGYYLLATVPNPKPTDRVLVISPHPDDETLAAGGLIQRSINDGAILKTIIVTDGNKHGLKDLRYQEDSKAESLLGVKSSAITYLNFPDGQAKNHIPEIQDQLTQFIQQFEPTILVYPYSLDEHLDHKTVGMVVDNIVRNQTFRIVRYQYLVHYPHYPRPGGYRHNSYLLPMLKTIDFNTSWSQFTLTPTEEQIKYRATREYKSQISAKNPILRELLVAFVRKNELFVVSH